MNRWDIYELLKNFSIPDQATIEKIDAMDPWEAREGLLEWLSTLNKSRFYQEKAEKCKEKLQRLLLE